MTTTAVATADDTRTYRVVRRAPGRRTCEVVTATVPGACPVCGRPRGVAKPVTVYDVVTGKNIEIDQWTNRCGHVDLHRDVIAEAQEKGSLT